MLEVYGTMYDRLRENIRHLHPLLDDWMIDEGYGKVLSRPGLDLPRRELCIVAACAATGQDRQLHSHLHGARNVGASVGAVDAAVDALAGVLGAARLRDRHTSLVAGSRKMSNVFVDRVVVNARAGSGGSGIVSFRREKFIPMGGPDGGDGGRGGDVIVVGDSNLATLLDYTYRDSWQATAGDHGSGNNKTGRSGAGHPHARSGRHGHSRSRHGGATRRSARGRRAIDRRARRTGREGQRLLHDLHASVAARISAGRRRRDAPPRARAQAHRRRRPRRPTERRQVDAAVGDFGGAPEDRRLPVHDARAESRRRATDGRTHVRRRRHSGDHRRRARRDAGSAFSSSGTSSGPVFSRS